MVSVNEIRRKLAAFLADEIDLVSFEDWIAQATWNIGHSEGSSAARLAHRIELVLSEFSSGHLDMPSLRAELRPLVQSYWIEVDYAEPFRISTSASDQITFQAARFGQPVDISLSVEFV